MSGKKISSIYLFTFDQNLELFMFDSPLQQIDLQGQQ